MHYQAQLFKLPANYVSRRSSDSPPYVFKNHIAISVDVALATGRPLLISGPPGSGKTTLAQVLAGLQGWRFLSHTLTSRSRLEHLTAEMDQLQRLHDAQAAGAKGVELLPDWAYQKPGLFWWGFDPESARFRGASKEEIGNLPERSQGPLKFPGRNGKNNGVVLLLDEIDKAEPDLPNDLLEPLGVRCFESPCGQHISAAEDLDLLVMITTNGERELPPAFLRRCATLELSKPEASELVRIAGFHFDRVDELKSLFESVAAKFLEIHDEAEKNQRRPPGTSEYLDAVTACLKLKVTPEHTVWKLVEQSSLRKSAVDDA